MSSEPLLTDENPLSTIPANGKILGLDLGSKCATYSISKIALNMLVRHSMDERYREDR